MASLPGFHSQYLGDFLLTFFAIPLGLNERFPATVPLAFVLVLRLDQLADASSSSFVLGHQLCYKAQCGGP